MGEGQTSRGISRRDLLVKVGVYGPPAVIAGGMLLRSGSAFAAVSESSSAYCPPSESSLSSSSSSGGGGCYTPLDFLRLYLSQLQSIPTPGNKGDQRKLASAIAALTEATTAAYWAPDGTTLVGSSGRRVFRALAKASEALSTLKAPAPIVASISQGIVTQAGTIANAAYSRAGLSGERAVEIERLLAKAAERAARGSYESAIEAYRSAWSKSTRSRDNDDGADA